MAESSRRWSTWRIWTILIFFCISSCCRVSLSSEVTSTTAATPYVPSEAVDNPNYWIKGTHSTSCSQFTVRTFLVETREGDPLSLVIRQNVKGTIVVEELPKNPPSSHKVQLALNWTANSEEVLSALQNSYRVEEGAGKEKVVLIQVEYVGDVKSKTNLSPAVVGGTVSGFLVMMALLVGALYMARRKSDATPPSASTGTPSLSSAADDDEDDEDTDYYHPSLYMTSHQEDDSLNLSMMPDLPPESTLDRNTYSSNTEQALRNHRLNDLASTGSVRSRSRPGREENGDDLPPPPPPPEDFEFTLHSSGLDLNADAPNYSELVFDSDGSLMKPKDNFATHTPPSELTRDNGQIIPNVPVYAIPNKRNSSQPPLPPAFKDLPRPRTQSTETNSSHHSDESSGGAGGGAGGGGGGGGGGGYAGSSMLGRTVMIVTMLSVITQVAYTMCHEDISVKVLIFIPTSARINNIHLYSNKDKPSVFEQTPWYLENIGKFKTFDVDDASTIDDDKLCSPSLICPTASNQTFLGCDWKSQQCVCKRGWELNSKQICVDVDECEMGRCPPEMACTNVPGSYFCTCNKGTFWNGEMCQPCKVDCPSGFFQDSTCNATMDRTCKQCSECTGGTFTFKSCTNLEDSQCMDVAQPYLQYPNAAKIDTNQVAIASASNVFTEELHKTGNLTYPLFVSDNNQIMNFVWLRSSGIRILIKVDDFNIIPEFDDVDHENDNSFVQSVMPQQKSFLNKVIYNYCRSPIPDYYMLTMNKYKDRTTVVRDIVCNRTLKNCPSRFSDGQVYRFRTYNTQCPKTSPEYDSTVEVNKLSNEGNSVVCNERTPLLSDIFNETLSRDQPLTFPSLGCKQAIWKCKECISTSRCGELGINESCCAVSCHAQRVCKEATSDACSAAPIECSTGDTVQFIVQPYFKDLSKQFLCHLNRKQPKYMFRLSYHIVVPTPDGWNSSRREVELATGGESEATQISDYITVKYNNYLASAPDGNMMLRGDYNPRRDEYDFSLFEFKPVSEFSKVKVRPVRYETLRNKEVMTSSIQNERPFDISTWNFNTKHGCLADTSKIHGRQLMYNNATGQRVQINMLKTNRGFSYGVRSVRDTPKVDFSLAGNESILVHYLSNSTLDYKSVKVGLVDKTEPFYVYAIKVSGTMQRCNSYLGITIYDKTTESTVARYDNLIFCSEASAGLPTFLFDIKIPDKGSKNKLFAVTLRDSHTTVSYFVTTYSYGSSLLQNNTVNLHQTEKHGRSQPTAFFSMLACLGAVGFAFGLLYILISYRIIIIARFQAVTDECAYATARRRLILSVYCVFKLAYSVIFSLSVLVMMLQIVCSSDLENVRKLPAYHVKVKQMVERNVQAITEFKRLEVDRQYNMKKERLEACGGYALESVEALRSYIDQYSLELRAMKNEIEDKKFELLMKEIQEYLEAAKIHVEKHKKSVDSQVTDLLSEYNALLTDMEGNSWLSIPFINYNSIVNRTLPKYSSALLSAKAVDFLSYIGVDRPSAALRQVELLNQQLNMMYREMTFDIDRNLGLGIVRGLDTSSVSMLSLKKIESDTTVNSPAFVIEGEAEVKSSGATMLMWIIIILCDILLLMYRMSSLSHTLYRLKNGYPEEIEQGSADKEDEHREDGDQLQVEMNLIKKQITEGEEMSTSLLDEAEKLDENLNLQNPSRLERQASSRAQSEAGASTVNHSDLEQPRVKSSDSEQPRNVKQPRVKHADSADRSASRAGSVLSESVSVRGERQRASRATSRAASTTGSTRQCPAASTNPPSVLSGRSKAESAQTGNAPSSISRATISPAPIHPGGCASTKLGRVLLSKHAIPTILWIASQVIAIIIISLLTELVTYNSLIQLTNIDSMISHIGMYTSVVNSYLTTHAQLISKSAQDTIVQEFNLHLHHIAKVKAILESDLNWSLLDYSNKQCVLNGKLIEHCTYQNQYLDVNVMPCQSFPIEAVQYTERDGLNINLVSSKLQGYHTSLISVITMFICLLTFYINAIAIIHIVSLVINKILHHKGFIHIILVKYSREVVPVIEPKIKTTKHAISSPSLVDSQRMSDIEAIASSDRSSRHDLASERSGYTQQSVGSREPRPTEEEDPLLKTIQAQHSLTKQLTDELSETSALLSPNKDMVGGASTSHDQSSSETEL